MISRYILGSRIDATEYSSAVGTICEWTSRGASRYVCCATVNNLMAGHDDPSFRQVTNEADLVTPDGMPLVWGLRLLGAKTARRVYGPDLTLALLAEAERKGIPVGFYGTSDAVLQRLTERVRRDHAEIRITYVFAPPFRELTAEEDGRVTAEIRESGCRILFVGLSSPKQDRWMANHRGRIDCVMLGVGAAFDFLAGTKPQAPRWMMRAGLEWLFRLATEPRRLWRRYLLNNPRFVLLFLRQLCGAAGNSGGAGCGAKREAG